MAPWELTPEGTREAFSRALHKHVTLHYANTGATYRGVVYAVTNSRIFIDTVTINGQPASDLTIGIPHRVFKTGRGQQDVTLSWTEAGDSDVTMIIHNS